MRVLKFKVPSSTIIKLGLPNYSEVVEYIEVLQLYEYDSKNLFALYRIIFKKGRINERDKILKEFFFAKSFQILEKKSNEILCIMKQRNSSGFWPTFLSKSFALIPPLIFDTESVRFSIIAKDDVKFNIVMKQLKRFKPLQLISIANLDEKITDSINPMPKLTNKQKMIMIYATRNGYFQSPKNISTENIANHFKISTSAVLDHIQKAKKSVMEYFFG